MGRSSFRSLISLHAVLLLGLMVIAFPPSSAVAQSFCGPVTVINFNGTNGANPLAGVMFDSQGNMYGTTSGGGGASGLGTIWKYTPSAGLTTLFTFSGSTSPSNNGYEPKSRLVIDGQGTLYGSTYYGGNDFNFANGQYGWGTLFKLSSSGQFTELYQFSGPDGANPVGTELIDSQGNVWGTNFQGGGGFNNLGNNGYGTIFKFSGGTLTSPILFNISDGENIFGGMATDGQGNYYGTTYQGGANSFGTLFRYNSTNGQLTTLFNFNRFPNGSFPTGNVVYDGKGNLYGTTQEGGSHSSASNYCCGTVWKYSLSTGVLTTLVNFDGDTVPADGIIPTSGVTLDSNGNIFGTTNQGGTSGDGIVYEYSSTGVLSTLVTFSGPNGQGAGDLAFDSSGNLWGVTSEGGSSSSGTLYELTPNSGSGCGPSILSVTFSPASIPNGGSTTGTVTLSAAAPSGGSVVSLVSGYPYIETPATVTVPAGSSSATFTGTAQTFISSDSTATITANLGNSTVQGSLTQTPGVVVKSISVRPSTVTGGNSTTATVTIASAAPSSGNQVYLQTNVNNTAAVEAMQLPITVTVPAGQSSGSFSLGTNSVSASVVAPIYAESGGINVSTNLTVNPGSSGPTLSSVSLNPATVTGGSNSTGTLTLSAAAPSGGTTVSLSSNSSTASVPNSVTIPSGSTSATFTVTTTSVTATTTATITGTLGNSVRQATLTINPPASLTISSLTLNPSTVTGGSSSTGTVTLSSAAPSGGTVVSLSSNSSSASAPSSVTVASGSTSATFTVTTTSVSTALTATITATLGSSSQIAYLIINPSLTLSSLTLNPTSVSGGNSSTGTVTLSAAAPSGGATVTLQSANTSVATVPSSVTVQAGQTSATFTVSTQRVSSNTNVLISGSYAGTTQNGTLTVTGRHH
jgi:uncharacterized repeat protein (TIGR03803 family)